ncbi:DNA-binding protein RFXANK isoform X2 [Octopus bimaculoides]|uniref:DNA-binding protein RFXANK isoform X2 n=1 Tax=Octopus bimaculoides TaxID=37653 RepID=UPI0022E4DE56|nr:DNA-binding protein RFXANK isoform X2 [Octopus bimaculoides]
MHVCVNAYVFGFVRFLLDCSRNMTDKTKTQFPPPQSTVAIPSPQEPGYKLTDSATKHVTSRSRVPISPVKKLTNGRSYHLMSPIDSDQELNDLEVATVLAEGESHVQKYSAINKNRKSDLAIKVTPSPFRPSTVITNLQRGNVQTTTPSIFQNISIHQKAAQGELVLLWQESTDNLNINKPDEQGLTALLWAAANGQLATVEYLLQNGANPYAQGNKGENALLFACCYGYIDIVKLLLKLGMEVNYVDESGNTALMYAVNNNHASCVKLLLEAGADLTMANEDQLTAMDLAVSHNHKSVQNVIENHLLSIFEGVSSPNTLK